jgi:cell division protein FtsW (lipid II flippase)
MKNRASSHMVVLLVIIALTALAHYSIYYGGLIRGFETSWLTAGRNLFLFVPFLLAPVFLMRYTKFAGNWTLYTSALLLFSIGLVGQYRLFTDPEYISSKDKAEARQEKIETLQLHYIQENYSAEKKRMMGLPPTDPAPVDLSQEKPRPSTDTFFAIATSTRTWLPLFAFLCCIGAYIACRREDTLSFLQKYGFEVVLLTLIPLLIAAVMSRAGKFLGGMTPWEPAKIPFLIGFAAIVTLLYKDRTYWGIPNPRSILTLVTMAVIPFIPFFVLKDFGQMLVFSAVYVTLYLIAVKKFTQRLVLVGSMLIVIGILVISALPDNVLSQVRFLPELASPVKDILPDRIQQRFHLWLDGFNPPGPETKWWKEDYDDYYKRLAEKLAEKNLDLSEMIAEDPKMKDNINVDAWFDVLAFQPAQATFGLSSGGTTGRGLGLGYPELIPVADSDYIYSALGEELGLAGGLLLIFALIIFVSAGVRTAMESRDMFSKLCCAGLTAFIGFQALVNIGGITRALPMTGITLPFVSHGGFSLITSFTMLGMLLAFSHRNGAEAKLLEQEHKADSA